MLVLAEVSVFSSNIVRWIVDTRMLPASDLQARYVAVNTCTIGLFMGGWLVVGAFLGMAVVLMLNQERL